MWPTIECFRCCYVGPPRWWSPALSIIKVADCPSYLWFFIVGDSAFPVNDGTNYSLHARLALAVLVFLSWEFI